MANQEMFRTKPTGVYSYFDLYEELP